MILQSREIEVLNIIVQTYIQGATPVGSRYVAKKSNLKLSPASIRNIMADLTDKGYLMQPYTSAGRIPTEKAFRFYVDCLLQPGVLSAELQENIKEEIQNASLDFYRILENTSKIISTHASLVGMALAPQKDFVRWQQVDFVLVRPGLIMAVMVFQGGIVQNKLLPIKEEVNTDDLIRYSNYLNDKFQGQTLFEVKRNLIKEIKDARNRFNALYYKALDLAKKTFGNKDEREVFVDGTLNVLDRLDNKDISSMRELLEFLEQRSNLLDLLDKISQSEGLTITFGNEFYGPKLGDWSLISSPYRVQGETLGIIGSLGPIHMDYSKVVPMVDYIAKMLSHFLEMRL